MPSPSLFEWCSTSINAIHRSVHQLINNYTKTDVETSNYLSSIQSLKGKTPGEKFKELNEIIKTIVETTKERGEFGVANKFYEISPCMTPLIRTLVGVHLKLSDLIVDALQSSDVSVVKKALDADWFFNGSDKKVNVAYYIENVMPYVSLRARTLIIKKLSRSLIGHEKKAEEFFEAFVELYGTEQNLPLLTACSQIFIFYTILKHKIILPLKIVNMLYDKYPSLVIRYLQLGNKENIDNVEDRKLHEIRIHEYDVFLPKLIKKHSNDFLELYKITPEKEIKLTNVQSELFIKKSKDALVKEPKIFLKLLPIKMVHSKLDKESFDTMLENMLPEDINDFRLDEMLNYIKDYTHDEKFQLLSKKFEKVYGEKLLDQKLSATSLELFKILPPDERINYAKSLFHKLDENSELYETCLRYLTPGESIPILKEKISKCSDLEKRIDLIGQMIVSCSLYNSKSDLLKVLEYYNDKHKNEQNIVLLEFLRFLKEEFNLTTLDKKHWSILRDILNYAYVKKELFIYRISFIESVLEDALFNLLIYHKDDCYLEKLLNLIVELKVEQWSPNWNVLKDYPDLEKECIGQFFQIIPLKYPESHAVWKEKMDRLTLTLNFVKAINDYNERYFFPKFKRKAKKCSINDNGDTERRIKIEDYPWILKLTEEYFSRSETSFKKKLLMKLIKRNAPEFYESKLDEYTTIRDIESGEALSLLKREPKKVLANWPDYLAEAREKLQSGNKAAKRFVAATKWHHEIPVKFVERCLMELKERGSIFVLGILLEGEAYEKIVSPFTPKKETLEANKKDAKENFELTRSIIKGIKYTNPPVSFDIVATFCVNDYVQLAEGMLMSVTNRISTEKVVKFAMKLVKKSISIKKRGIRLMQKVATKPQMRKFLEEVWMTESDSTIRQIIAKMIFDIFIKVPNSTNWELMKNCINGLNVDDKIALERFSDIEKVESTFLGNYIEEYLIKIEKLFELGLDFHTRTKCVILVIESIDSKFMHFIPEETSLMILKKYFFDTDSLEISRVVQNFAIRSYLLMADEKFEVRLKTVMDILIGVMEKFDTPHPKKPRFYAANYTTHEFFGDMLTEISCNNYERSLEIIQSMLRTFTSILAPWQEPWSYLSLNIFKEYLLTDTLKDFGISCAKTITYLIEDFAANESIINDISKCLNDIIVYKIQTHVKLSKKKLSIIEGLIEGDDFYGSLVSIKLLSYDEVDEYDDRYDNIIRTLRHQPNETIQYNLYKHLNSIKYDEQYT